MIDVSAEIAQLERRQAAYQKLTESGDIIDDLCACLEVFGIPMQAQMLKHLYHIANQARTDRIRLEQLREIEEHQSERQMEAARAI